MAKTILEIKCHNCGSKHCSSTLCLNETYSEGKSTFSFEYQDRGGLSRSIFVSKEDLKKLVKQIKEILK